MILGADYWWLSFPHPTLQAGKAMVPSYKKPCKDCLIVHTFVRWAHDLTVVASEVGCMSVSRTYHSLRIIKSRGKLPRMAEEP